MKKTILLTFFLTMVMAMQAAKGDTNGDGTVDVGDIMTIINYMASPLNPPEGGMNVDVNDDGTVDVGDIMAVINIMATSSGNEDIEDNTVIVTYNGTTATVVIADNIKQYITATINGAHVSIVQSDDVSDELTYVLSGSSDDGAFHMKGSYKATVELRGLTLTNATPGKNDLGAAINIMNGKRIALSVKKGTTNTLTDAEDGTQKAALYCKGHLELKGQGTLNVSSNTTHAIKSADYMSQKNCTVNVLKAAKDGISCNQYFLMESGTLTISATGDDGIQTDIDGNTRTGETAGHEDEDSGNIYIEGGTIDITVTATAAKGMKAAGDVSISGGTITVNQSGDKELTTTDDEVEISYPTSIKADGNVSITGGTISIDNTADGGKGISADGTLTIDQTKATTTVDIKANGTGGAAEATTPGDVTPSSYRVYVAAANSGGQGGGPGGGNSSAWGTIYLYSSDGTQVAQLTATVTKTSGNSSYKFYYYDFGEADTGTYYFKGNNYTSRQNNTTYTIRTATFEGPSSGTDIYYLISNSYSTSGTTRTYALSNVTNDYGGSSDESEDSGKSYNAAGLKADGNLTINGGTVTIANSGTMSKSIKSKATTTINGGTLTLAPSGGMKVIDGDASYSIGVKTVDYIQNGGTLTITATGTAGRGISADNITTNGGTLTIDNNGAGYTGSSDAYTAKGLKADTDISLNAGTVSIAMTGNGGKGIKSKGTYTQGTSDGSGPTLTVSTTGSSQSSGSTTGGGGGWGGPGGWGGSSGSSAKAIKIMGIARLYGGTTEVTTATNGAEGLESKSAVYIEGGQHYLKCYDDCINSSGKIFFNGGATVCYSFGNDAVDSNAGTTGAITIGNGAVLAYTTKGSPEEGLDCDNNSYIQITGTGHAISAGGTQGGTGSSTISNAKQGYFFYTNTLSYSAGRYYTLSDADGNNLITYSLPAAISSTLALFTAKGMEKGTTYYLRYADEEPTDATTSWHGLYLGSSHQGTSDSVIYTKSGSTQQPGVTAK